MASIEIKWAITAILVAFWAWRLYVVGWFGNRKSARQGDIPGYSLIIVACMAGSWNTSSLLDHRIEFGPSIGPDTLHIIAQYFLICLVYLAFPWVRGLRSDGDVQAISWLVAGAFVVGSVGGPVFTFFDPE